MVKASMPNKTEEKPKLRWGQPIKRQDDVTFVFVHAEYGTFKATLLVDIRPGASVAIKSLLIEETDDVTVTLLQKQLKLGELRQDIARYVRNHAHVLEWSMISGEPTDEQIERAERIASEVKDHAPAPKRGRGAKNPDFYRLVAEEYLAYCDTVGRGARKAMAEARGVPDSTLGGWIKEARKQLWLSKPPGDRMGGGEPGTRLVEWRKEHGE